MSTKNSRRFNGLLIGALIIIAISLEWISQRTELTPTLQVPQFGVWVHNTLSATPTPQPTPLPANSESLITWIQTYREEQYLHPFDILPSLNAAAQQLAQDALESGELPRAQTEQRIRDHADPVPARSTVLHMFIPDSASDWTSALRTEELLLDPSFTQLGIATVTGTQNGMSGTSVVVLASVPRTQLGTAQNTQAISSTTITWFTEPELWTALQNYRQAHALPQFQRHEELCVVAQDRLAEQIALKKLDAHAGFNARADRFFAEHPGWKSLNENLASGYRTAVQTVEWGWDQSLGHQALMKSTEHPYACTAAQDGFAVLITGS